MPRNLTGGSGHKAQRNSEGGKARHNRELVDDLLDDLRKGENTNDIHVARVLRRMGCGRMEVLYFNIVADNEGELAGGGKKMRKEPIQQIVPMRGGLRGRGKGTVWVDIDSLVMVVETGLAVTTHEIVAVFTPEQVARYRKLVPDADERLFLKGGSEATSETKNAVIFEDVAEEEEVDVDDI